MTDTVRCWIYKSPLKEEMYRNVKEKRSLAKLSDFPNFMTQLGNDRCSSSPKDAKKTACRK